MAMQQLFQELRNPWLAGPFRAQQSGLLFGAMYEDPAVELNVFAPDSQVFCIASAGCTALALSAAGHETTAVDVNPEQILYAQARATGGPVLEGTADRLLSKLRELFPLLGWTEGRLRHFLNMNTPKEQLSYWRDTLDTRRWRLAVDTALSTSLLPFVYRRNFLKCLPAYFGSILRRRLERTWREHPNDSNPYAKQFLLGITPPIPKPTGQRIHFACEEAAIYLENCKPASFDAFSLSNIADGASPSYVVRLCRAVNRAARRAAIVVMRTLAEPKRFHLQNLAARDRAMIWGGIHVIEATNLCSIF